jgi:hypothetical protein
VRSGTRTRESLDRGSLYDLFDGTLGSLQQLEYHIPEAALLDSLNQDYQDFLVSEHEHSPTNYPKHEREADI